MDISIFTNGDEKIVKPALANDNEPEIIEFTSVNDIAYNIGDALSDGWIVGGISPTTGNVFSIEPKSGALEGNVTSDEGDEHALELRDQGHDVRRMDSNELGAIFKNTVAADHNDIAEFDASKYGKIRTSTHTRNSLTSVTRDVPAYNLNIISV